MICKVRLKFERHHRSQFVFHNMGRKRGAEFHAPRVPACRQSSAAGAQAPKFTSVLARYLIQCWSWGELSLPHVQKIGALVATDLKNYKNGEMNIDELEVLAGLGTHGFYPNHMHAEIMRKLPPTKLPQPCVCDMPLLSSDHVTSVLKPQSIIWPHELFSTLYHEYPWHFRKTVVPSTAKLHAFWDSQEFNVALHGHPVQRREGWRDLAVPISVHGDGVPVVGVGKGWSMSLEILTWMSLLGVGSTLETNFYIYSIFKDLVVEGETVGTDTYKTFWRKLRWSMMALWRGTFPFTDENGHPLHGPSACKAGEPLAGGFFGVMYVLRGDLEWAWERLKLCNYRAVTEGPCCYCPCNGRDIPWTDFRLHPRAAWMTMLRTAEWWHENHDEIIELMTLPGVSHLTFYGDMMHTKHLGTDAYFFGSVLWMLSYLVLPGTATANIETVWQFIHQWYRDHPEPRTVFGTLMLSMFSVPEDPTASYPMLKGRAAEIRHLGPPLLAAWRHYADMSDMAHKQVEIALSSCVEMELIVDRHVEDPTLPPDDAQKFHDAVFDFLACYSYLANHFATLPIGSRRKLFNTTVKFHFLAHLGLLAWSLNPRYGWCYSGEDMMQKTKTLMQSCLRGLGTDKAPAKMLQKYLYGLHIMMMDSKP